jgi:hypothetical protein
MMLTLGLKIHNLNISGSFAVKQLIKFFDILEKVVRRVSNNFIDHIIFRTHHFWLV